MRVRLGFLVGGVLLSLSGCAEMPSSVKSYSELLQSYEDSLTRNERTEAIDKLKSEKQKQDTLTENDGA